MRAAIEENEASPGFSDWGIITLPAGTYTLTLGYLPIVTNTTIVGEGMGITTIDANHARAFFLSGTTGYNVFIQNLTLVNAEALGFDEAAPAIYIAEDANVSLYRVGIYDSKAGWIAGAILNNGYLSMIECQMVRNSAPKHDASGQEGSGGAIVNSGTLQLVRSTFQLNEGTQGGAIYNSGRIEMTNCTFSGNKATYRGGAIFNGQRTYLVDPDASISAAFCTFKDNEVWIPTVDSPAPPEASACGGAICNYGVFSMGSSIVAGNVDHRSSSHANYSPDGWSAEHASQVLDTSVTPPVWVPYQAHPYFYSHRNNVLGVVDASVWNIHDQTWGDLRFERAGTEAAPLDPLLQDIRFRGIALVHELLPGSPALDFASAVTSATFFDCPETDQRGAPRPPDGTGNGTYCDAGAFEVSATTGVLEAEDADTGPNFAKWPDPSASGGYAVMAGNGTGNRLGGPDEAYRIRFEVFVDQSGPYNIKAWGRAASIDDNSFWVQVDDDPVGGYLWDLSPVTDTYTEYFVSDRGAGTENAPAIPRARVFLSEGMHTLDFYLREDGARLDRIQIVPEVTPVAPALEAEAAALVTGQFLIVNDASASGGKYVTTPAAYSNTTGIPNNADRMAITVNLSQSGTYLIRADVQATFDDKNSFWVKVDGLPGYGYLWDITESHAGYDPDYVSDRGNGTSADPQFDPVEIQLSAGPHTIEIFAREGGTRLDRIGLELKQEADAKIVSRGKPVTSSSADLPLYPANSAVDGYPTTRWASLPGDNQWLQVDLQARHRVRRVMLDWGAAFGREYEIQVSDDGSAWTTLYRKTGSLGGTDNLMMDGTGRYVRMRGIAQGAGNGYSLKEFDVYGEPATGFVCQGACLTAQFVSRYQNAVLNTTGERWFYATENIAGWQASESAGRTISVNGVVVTPGQMPLPPKVNGRYYFHFSAGTHPWAAWSFWN